MSNGNENPPDHIPGHGELVFAARFCAMHYSRLIKAGGQKRRFRSMHGSNEHLMNQGCDVLNCRQMPVWREAIDQETRLLAKGND